MFPTFAGILHQLAASRPLYWLLWCGLAVSAIALILLARSRWGRAHTLERCAVLSLVVHLLLACLAMTVQLVVGDDGSGMGPPIRVHLVEEIDVDLPVEAFTPPLVEQEPFEAPPLEEPPTANEEQLVAELEQVPDVPLPESTDPMALVEPPPLLSPPEPDTVASEPEVATQESEPIVADAVDKPQSTTVDAPPPPVEVESIAKTQRAAEKRPPQSESWTSADARPTDTPVMTGAVAANSPYARRSDAERLRWAESQGGSQQTEAAVAAALKWLAEAQSADGRWDASQFGAGVEMVVLGQNRGGAGADADTGITALATLAFMGAGHTHQGGAYASQVAGGLEFLIRGQATDGNLSGATGLYTRMYCHSMSTFALAEALAMTGDNRLEPTVRRAVNYCLRAQNPSSGGWRYRVGDGDIGDTSQLGWQLMALWSAERAGIDVPPQTWTGAERFLRSVRRGQHGGLASYRPDGPASAPMTAEALYCRQLVGQMIGGDRDLRLGAEATVQLLSAPPESSRINLYYWYYATLALHHQQQSSEQSLQAWQQWNAALTSVLLGSQVSEGTNAGSWNPNTVWGGYGGRVYSTAVAAMCLEVYYRYAPAPAAEGWMATRPEVRRLPY